MIDFKKSLMSNPYSFEESVPHNYFLSEEEKHELIRLLQKEFDVSVTFNNIEDLKKECNDIFQKFMSFDDNIYDDILMLQLIERMSEVRHQMIGNGIILLKRKKYSTQQRWSHLWNRRYPFPTFKEICVYELNITHFDGSDLDKACRHLHKHKMKHLNKFL